MAVQIQIRRGTATEWSSANPTLAQGEIGLELDTGQLKIGDGSTEWNSLDYYLPDITWGDIGGTLSNQTDLKNALDAKEGTITAGTSSQCYRGDKSWQTLDKSAVGLDNVDNTSDADKPVSTATQNALDDKFDTDDVLDEDDMASNSDTKVPTQQSVKAYVDNKVFEGAGAVQANLTNHIQDVDNPHNVTAEDVGLGNVDNTSDATKNAAVATLTNKTLTSPTINTPTTDVISLTEQSSSPANPSSGTKKFYAKNDGKLYSLDSDGNERKVGSGGGASAQFIGGGTVSWANETYQQVDTTDIEDADSIEQRFIGPDRMAGPSFVAEKDVHLKELKINVKWEFDDPSTGTFHARVYELGEDNKPAGSHIAASGTLGHAEVGSDFAEKTLTFSNSPVLKKGTSYAVVIYNGTNGIIVLGIITGAGSGKYLVAYEDMVPSGQDWTATPGRTIAGFTLTLEGPNPALTTTEDIKLGLPGLSPTDNIIEAIEEPFFLEDGEFLYVVPNDAPGGAALIPQVTTGPIPEDALIVGFRDGEDLILASQRIKLGFPTKLNTGSQLVLPPKQTDWEAFTPTGGWTNVTYTGFKKRVGGDLYLKIRGELTDAPVGTTLTINLPDSLSIDTDKVLSTGSSGQSSLAGTAVLRDSSASNRHSAQPMIFGSTTSFALQGIVHNSASNHVLGTVGTTVPFTWASGDSFEINVVVPIDGWDNSSNIVDVAEVSITPAVASAIGVGGAQSGITTLTTIELVNTSSKFKETPGALEWDADNYGFRVKKKIKKLSASGQAHLTASSTNDRATIYVTVNGSVAGVPSAVGNFPVAASTGQKTVPVSGVLYDLEPGDLICLAVNLHAGTAINHTNNLSVTRLDLTEEIDLTAVAAIAGGENDKMPEVRRIASQRTVNYASDEYVPIVASGSNSDGSWVRYADGTQICRNRQNASDSDNATWTFPVPFASTSDASVAVNPASSSAARIGTWASMTTTNVLFSSWTVAETRVASICGLTAIGRWK